MALWTTESNMSQIFTELPLRVIDQMVKNATVSYPLMDLVTTEMPALGSKQYFYRDYRDGDNLSGYSDVTISDYNKGREKIYTETVKPDTEWHKGYDILDSMLNDVTVTAGLFIALLQDYELAVARPLAKFMYTRWLTQLADSAFYQSNLTFPAGSDAKIKAKEITKKLFDITTPSRKHLTIRPTGAPVDWQEYSANLKNFTLIFNAEYASDYKYDLTANTFQLGEITFGVSKITILDFDRLAEYLPATATAGVTKLKAMQVILIENGTYSELIHYVGQKITDTPKLKSVLNKYLRLGNYRVKTALALNWA